MKNYLPNFIIAGAPKAGTTSLYHYLRLHPDIFLPYRKEIMFFDMNFKKGIDWYKKHFRNYSGEKLIGEMSPTYMANVDVPARIHAVIPNVKIIFILRNPIDRAYSHYWDLKGWGVKGDFRDILLNPPTIKRGRNSYLKFDILKMGYYYEHLSLYKKYFKEKNIGIFLFSELSDDPQKLIKDIFNFLGVDNILLTKDVLSKHNSRRKNKSKIIGNLLVSEELRDFAYKIIPNSIFPFCRKLYDVLLKVNTKKVNCSPMNKKDKEFLKEKYYKDIKKLEQLIDKDLSRWL
jgi:hypothetical protein